MSERDRAEAGSRSGEEESAKAMAEMSLKVLSPNEASIDSFLQRYTSFVFRQRPDEGKTWDIIEPRECPPAGDGQVQSRVVPPADQPVGRLASSGGSDSSESRCIGPKAPRRRRRGRRGPDRFDADYYLGKLQQDIVSEGARAGDTQQEIRERIQELQRKTSEELAQEVSKRFKIYKDGRTYRRNSKLYQEWKPQRDAAQGRQSVDRQRRPKKVTPPRTRADVAEADVIDGQLSQRDRPNGPIRGRSREDCRKDAKTDAWFRGNGVDPRDFRAE